MVFSKLHYERIMNHELVFKIWAYNPTTGEITRSGDPVRTLWFPDKNPDCGYRCQVNHDGANYSYKAEHVAWCLLTGQDLPKNHKPQHISGNKRDNRAANLYLVIEAAKTNDPNYYTVILPDTKLARYLYPNGRKTGATWTCDAPLTLPIWDENNLLTVNNRIKPCYLSERCRIDKLPYDAPVDLDHFSAWVFANVDPRTSAQRLADQQAGQTARELGEIDHPYDLWPAIVETLIKQNGKHKAESTFNTVLRWKNLHIKHGRKMHPLIEQCIYEQGPINRWKEKQKIYVL